jgi:hypothetical protein
MVPYSTAFAFDSFNTNPKKKKNIKIRTGVSGVLGDSLCNRLAGPQLA